MNLFIVGAAILGIVLCIVDQMLFMSPNMKELSTVGIIGVSCLLASIITWTIQVIMGINFKKDK